MEKVLFFMVSQIAWVGRGVFSALEGLGRGIAFVVIVLFNCFVPPFYPRSIFRQIVDIGYFSLPLIGLTALFTGMVLALQSYIGFARFSAENAIANIIVISLVRELGPVLSGLMVAGRIAGSIAAEIGSMRVSDQISALHTMAVDPIKYLITPKIIAGIITLPILVIFADIIGVLGGFLVAVFQLGFSAEIYLQHTWDNLYFYDVFSGLVKACAFGLIITSMGSFYGYFTSKGAKGVGRSTTNAVVVSSITILAVDYLLTLVFH